jgi:transcriptional regulator with XRE-family HTH domain
VFARCVSLHPAKMRHLEMSDAFAIALRRQRNRRGLSQEALAEKADLHPTYIGMLERSLRNPTLNVTKALAKALNISLSRLIAEAEAIQQRGR